MTLASQFKIDIDAVRDGVWFDYEPNTDGTIPGFKIARTSKHNKKYMAAMRDVSERYANADGFVDMSKMEQDEIDAMLLPVFFKAVLIEWRNFQPDDDGQSVPYSQEAAQRILGSDDWIDLREDLAEKAQQASHYRKKLQEVQAKN